MNKKACYLLSLQKKPHFLDIYWRLESGGSKLSLYFNFWCLGFTRLYSELVSLGDNSAFILDISSLIVVGASFHNSKSPQKYTDFDFILYLELYAYLRICHPKATFCGFCSLSSFRNHHQAQQEQQQQHPV